MLCVRPFSPAASKTRRLTAEPERQPVSPSPTRLEQLPVTRLKGVGPHLAGKLAKLGLHNVQQLLFHLPTRYLDRTRITPIGALQPGTSVVIEAEIRACDITFGRRRSLVCRLQDGTGTLGLRFYYFTQAQKQRLLPGTRLRCSGEVRRGAAGLEIYHPRSEEHTSELQSRPHLVCRLLL